MNERVMVELKGSVYIINRRGPKREACGKPNRNKMYEPSKSNSAKS